MASAVDTDAPSKPKAKTEAINAFMETSGFGFTRRNNIRGVTFFYANIAPHKMIVGRSG